MVTAAVEEIAKHWDSPGEVDRIGLQLFRGGVRTIARDIVNMLEERDIDSEEEVPALYAPPPMQRPGDHHQGR